MEDYDREDKELLRADLERLQTLLADGGQTLIRAHCLKRVSKPTPQKM